MDYHTVAGRTPREEDAMSAQYSLDPDAGIVDEGGDIYENLSNQQPDDDDDDDE